MIKESLFTKNKVRVINLLAEHLQEFNEPYVLMVSNFDIKVQSCFSPKLISALKKKRFKTKIQDTGYLNMSKTIGRVELVFIFTN